MGTEEGEGESCKWSYGSGEFSNVHSCVCCLTCRRGGGHAVSAGLLVGLVC